jgi:uncharacterized repeat protein (TIGR01451 family)
LKRFFIISLLMLAALLLFVSSVASKRRMFASADLSITKVDSPDPVNAGSQLTYTITVSNNGPDPATDAIWSDALPADTYFVSLSSESGWSCTTPAPGDNGTIECSNSSFSVGSSVFTLNVTASSASTPGSTISNTATVTSSTPEGSPGNESATASTTVLSPSIITGVKSVSGDTSPGSTVSYVIGLSNSGGAAQADNPGPEFTDVLPADLTLVSADAGSGTATADLGTNTVTWNGRIEQGTESVTITITATIKSGTEGHTVSNQGTMNYDADGNGTNEATAMTNSVNFMVGASASTDLSLTKTAPSQIHPDTNLTYTITVMNPGPNAATNVSFTDNLPNSFPSGFQMTFVSFNQDSGPPWNDCNVMSSPAVCKTSTLPAGTTSTFSFVGHVPSGAPDNTEYTNQTTVSSSSDPFSENNTGNAVTTVSSCFSNPVVTTNADSGAGSLRQAISTACDGSTISFDMNQVVSPIQLSTGELAISKNLTIAGPGPNLLTITSNQTSRVFNIGGVTAVISGLTVANAKVVNASGGGISIDAAGTLTLTDITLSGNSANANGSGASSGGGIYNLGTVTINNSTLNGNSVSGGSSNQGGAIFNNGTATIINSTLSGNTVSSNVSGGAFGGAINNQSTLTLTNSTLNGNAATGGSENSGGGIYNTNDATISNSTFNGNSASGGSQNRGGGIYLATGTVTITNGTLSGNSVGGSGTNEGGGIYILSGGSTNARNTIIANNIAANGPDVSGTINSQGHNLIFNQSGATITGDTTGNLPAGTNPQLGPLQNNGGPTQTMALLVGSPALDAGDNCVVDNTCSVALPGSITTDQRGFARNVDGPDADTTATVDIGALEAQVSLANITDKTTKEDTQLQFTFNVGGANISATATSSNTALVPNNAANIAVSGSGSTRTLTINPAANLFGTSTITVTVTDNNSQTMTDTFLLTVTSLNDAPSFTKGADQAVNEEASAQTVPNWATNMSPGPEDESGQTLAFTVTNNTNPALFSAAPAVSPSGTLTYTPAPNANGIATITLVLMDNGGTANGGQDTSAPQSFTITINPIADTPAVTNASTTVNTQTTSGLVISRNPSDGAEVTNFKITNITGGTLFKNNGTTPINNGAFITFAEGNAGLKFTPALNSNANGSFQVQASVSNSDAGLGGGLATATISVNCGPTVVINSSDSGAGSLRETILHACAGATITFDLTPGKVANPITLTSSQLSINKNLIIQGPNANILTVLRSSASDTPQFRIFSINSGSTVSISGLTISNGVLPDAAGNDGAGIFNQGSLMLSASVVTGNSTGRSGGGVTNAGPSGTMTISGSTISGNGASAGSGIANGGTLTILNSTISGNILDGLSNSSPGVVTLVNDTFAGNGFRGISNNSGATVNMRNTIAANSGGGAPDVAGSFNSQGNNLIGNRGSASGFTNGVNSDKAGTTGAVLDPLLAPLANYGGSTPTMALLPGSPAIDSGSNSGVVNPPFSGPPFTDQRGTGFSRIVNGSVDIGAFESRGFTISVLSGTPQSATILSAFGAPLVASITGVGGEPVNGGVVTFTAPATGASAALTGGGPTATATIAAGQATVNATANGVAGSYNVIAGANGATSASLSLTNNKGATTTTVTSSVNPSDFNQSVTFTATVAGAVTPTGTVQFKDNGGNLGSPAALNGSGVAQVTTSTLAIGNHTITADYSGDGNLLASTGTLAGGQMVRFRPLIKFSQPTYSVNENGNVITITVARSGDTSLPVTVDYATPDDSAATSVLPCSNANGVASPRCDFTTTTGTLRFAAGETIKTFNVLISQDLRLEGNETVQLTLSNPTGGGAFQQPSDASAVLTIVDDDVTSPTTNAIDNSSVFVRQHYHDFLNREPDQAGFNFWVNQIESCGADTQCRAVKRNNVSAAFFLSIEFQNTGYFVERMYKAAYGDIAPPTVPVPVRFTEFVRDTQQIRGDVIVGVGDWQTQLDNNKKAFALDFVQRTAFLNRYPALTSETAFVDALNANAGMVLSDSERSALIAELAPNPSSPALRADVLMKVADNAVLQQREFNRAFVLMQYFGYLRRNPDAAPEASLNFNGYNFWLGKLNQFNGDYIGAEMIKAFITSGEYRGRFGP